MIFSAAGCLVQPAFGISGKVFAQGTFEPVQIGAPFRKAARRAAGTTIWPGLRLSRELGITGSAENLSSGSLPELSPELSAIQPAAVVSTRIPLPAGDLSRAGIVPASRLRLQDGSLILEANATDDQGKR